MEEHKKDNRPSRQLPLKVLSTSLGVALAANLFLIPGAYGEGGDASGQPKLVEWSSDEVKKYFDPNLDWNIPLPEDAGKAAQPQPSGSPAPGAAAGGGGAAGSGGTGGYAGGGTVVVHEGGGFGWDDLLLYHMIFNNGGAYSSSAWSSGRPVYDYRTNQPYAPKTFDSTTFQNRPTANSNVKPKTSGTTGTFSSKGAATRSSATTGTSAGGGASSGGTSAGSGASAGKSGSSSTGAGSSGSSGSSGFSSSGSSGSSSSGKSTSSSSGSIGGKSGGFSSGGSSSGG